MMRKLILLMVPFVLIGCSQNTQSTESVKPKKATYENYSIFYKGESPEWKIDLVTKIDGTKDGNKEEDHAMITYKGKDINAVGKTKISFALANGVMQNKNVQLYPDGNTTIESKFSGKPIPPDNYVVKATLQWNGKSETIDLR